MVERDGEEDSHELISGERNRSRTRNGKTAGGQARLCKRCGEPLTGQFVRALGGTFHLDCFKCRVRYSCRLCELHLLTYSSLGLWANRGVEIFPSR